MMQHNHSSQKSSTIDVPSFYLPHVSHKLFYMIYEVLL